MTIEQISITPAEMIEAVEGYLANRGIKLSIKSVESFGYPLKGWNIEGKPIEKIALAEKQLTETPPVPLTDLIEPPPIVYTGKELP